MKRLLILILLALCPQVLAQGKAQVKGAKPGEAVNWEGQVVKATGSGAPDMKAASAAQARLGAEMAAKMDAFRNLLSQAKGVQITSGRTVNDEMKDGEVKGRVEGIIRGYRITDKRYFSDQGVEIDVEVPLAAIASAVYKPEGAVPVLNRDGEAKSTGLIVDARGLKISPALSPRILDEAGAPLYSASVLSEEVRAQKTPASYFASVDAAKKKADLVGDQPLLLKAARVNGSDLVLDADSVKRLAADNNGYLAEGRVAIVADQR